MNTWSRCEKFCFDISCQHSLIIDYVKNIVSQQLQIWRRCESLRLYPADLTSKTIQNVYFVMRFITKIKYNNNTTRVTKTVVLKVCVIGKYSLSVTLGTSGTYLVNLGFDSVNSNRGSPNSQFLITLWCCGPRIWPAIAVLSTRLR